MKTIFSWGDRSNVSAEKEAMVQHLLKRENFTPVPLGVFQRSDMTVARLP